MTLRCAFCHEEDAPTALERCPGCGTRVHAECRAVHGACPTLGCPGACSHVDRPLGRTGRTVLRLARWLLS